jgi:hypothetical protein
VILKQNGYATGAIVNAPTLKPATRVNRGFDHYHALRLDQRLADGTTEDVLAWIDTVDDRPFFMFAHYFDPHRPYAPPAPYHDVYDVDYKGRIGNTFNLEGFSLVKSEMCEQMKALTEEDWGHIVALYDGEIAFTDHEIGNLLRGLESRGLTRNTLIVFLSDHGEEFYEHRCYGHGHSLYDELLRVPLVFSLQGVLPVNTRIKRQVRLVDVAPTILDMLGLEIGPGFEGVSLKSLLEGKGHRPNSPNTLLRSDLAFAESISQGPELKCIMRYPWKLIYNTVTQEHSLFRLDTDPEERRNKASLEPDILASLESTMFPMLFELSETWCVELSGGENGCDFDLKIKAKRDLGIGRIHPYKLLDRSGRIVRAQPGFKDRGSGSVIELSVPDLEGTCVLAFQVSPPDFPLEVDIAIEGRHAAHRVYLGKGLDTPGNMPITFKGARRRVRCPHRPAGDLGAPYALIWLDEAEYAGDILVDHDDGTKEEFRALGYIQ